MTRDEILALVKRRHAAWALHDPVALPRLPRRERHVASPIGGVLEGRAEIERVYRLWFSAFPDIVLEQDDLLIDGDRVVQVARMSGTHSGDFFGLPPTGRHVECQVALVLTVADGLVVEERRIYDFTGVLVQVGVLKAKPTLRVIDDHVAPLYSTWMLPFPRSAFEQARARMGEFVYHTPLLTSRLLSERTGFDVRLKAEMFQRGGSYKIRGPMNKFAQLTDEQKRRGVICSSAGNHAQGVALAAARHGIKAVVCMAENATPSKIAATRAYGAEVVLHGTIWDEANEKAKQLVAEKGYTYIHPFDDEQLIVGQGTVGLEIYQDWPEVELAIVPIGGGGLISGVATALKACNPAIKVIGVESSGAPGMTRSVREGACSRSTRSTASSTACA